MIPQLFHNEERYSNACGEGKCKLEFPIRWSKKQKNAYANCVSNAAAAECTDTPSSPIIPTLPVDTTVAIPASTVATPVATSSSNLLLYGVIAVIIVSGLFFAYKAMNNTAAPVPTT